MSNQIDCDAIEFGSHFKQGGWRLGLLVARNCEPKQGKRTDLATGGEVKVSCDEFASKAGVSASTVKYYYAAWGLAADAGYCLSAKELSPGQDDLEDFDEDDFERREIWSKFYQKAREPKQSKQKVEEQTESKTKEEVQTDSKSESDSATVTLSEEELDAQFRHERIINAREALEVHQTKLSELSVVTAAEDLAAVQEIMKIAEAILVKCKELTKLKSVG
jgi:hypothetical protein